MYLRHDKELEKFRSMIVDLASNALMWKSVYEDQKHWVNMEVTLEFPLGEIAKDWVTTLVLTGGRQPKVKKIDKSDRFNAQGLEGKCSVKKRFVSALANMQLLPVNRGRIVIDKKELNRRMLAGEMSKYVRIRGYQKKYVRIKFARAFK